MRDVAADMVAAWARHLGTSPREVDPGDLRDRLTSDTVPVLLARAARAHAASTLAVDDARVTLAELHDRAARRAQALTARGVDPGCRVVIAAHSSLELVVTYLAALHAGAVVVLANPAYTAEELGATVARSGARLLVTEEAADPPPGDVRVCSLDALAEEERRADRHPGVPSSSDSVALLAFTSGTTGSPKGVPLSHGHLLSSIRAAMWAWRWTSSDTLVHALPLFHQHGLSGVHATLVAGSSARIMSRFDPQVLVDTVEREHGTVLFGVPSIHRRLLDLPPERLEP